MKKENVCPGCGKHCPLSCPRCKYGMRYAAKQQKEEAECKKKKQAKWERYVTPNSTAHLMLSTSRRVKKALCHQEVTENELFAAFTPFEKEIFTTLLQKLSTQKSDS